MSKSSKFILGALLGAAAAVLLTPVTGKKARSALRTAAEKKGLNVSMVQEKVESLLMAAKRPSRQSVRGKTKTKK